MSDDRTPSTHGPNSGNHVSHILVPKGSSVTADRARKVKAGRDWDRRLLGGGLPGQCRNLPERRLDAGRFHWTGDMPVGVTVVGAALMLLGQVLFAVAKPESAFFSSTVRIQTERGSAQDY